MKPAVRIEMYSRPGCGLCGKAARVIRGAMGHHAFEFRVVDIEGDPELEARYGTEIPVVTINGAEAFRHRVDPGELEARLERM